VLASPKSPALFDTHQPRFALTIYYQNKNGYQADLERKGKNNTFYTGYLTVYR
jgi:hypothetical protein